MPDTNDRRALQSLYPEAQARSGMDAKAAIKFTVPIFRLTFLLSLPLFSVVVLLSLFSYSDAFSRTALALNSIALFGAIIVAVLLSIVMLAYARSIIVRNCSHSIWVEALYVLIVFPAAFVLMENYKMWFGETSILQMIGIEGVVIVSLVFPIVLIAHRLTR